MTGAIEPTLEADFVLGEPRIMNHSGGDDLIRVPDQDATRLAVALDSQLNAILDGHKHDAANERNAFGRSVAFSVDDCLGVGCNLLGCLNHHLFDELARQPGVVNVGI